MHPVRITTGTVPSAKRRTMRKRNAIMPGIVPSATVRMPWVHLAPAVNFTAERMISDWRSEKIVCITGTAISAVSITRRIIFVPLRIRTVGTARPAKRRLMSARHVNTPGIAPPARHGISWMMMFAQGDVFIVRNVTRFWKKRNIATTIGRARCATNITPWTKPARVIIGSARPVNRHMRRMRTAHISGTAQPAKRNPP